MNVEIAHHSAVKKVLSLLICTVFALDLFAATTRPNIILIVSDNQSSTLLNTYGNKEILTPNIDRLAAEGIKFDNAFAVNGVCSPTRAALLTGLMPSQTGIHVALPTDIDLPGWSGIEEFRSLPQTLSEAGYSTGLVGKYHLGMAQNPQIGFQYWVTFPSGHTTTFYDQTVIDNGEQYTVAGHLTDFWTEKAVDFLSQQKKDKPFFLYLTYNGPYNLPPTVNMEPRNRHAAHYIENPPSMPQEKIHPFLKNWAKGIRGPSNFMVNEGTTAWQAIESLNNRTAMINAASETTMVDDGVGTIMSALKTLDMDQDTIVIYTSDQGAAYGHHGLWGNTSWSFPFVAYNINMQVPLIVRQPGSIPEGRVSDSFINQFDLFPTLLNYVGMGEKEILNSPGKNFSPMLKGKKLAGWENVAFFEFVTVRVIRTPRWIYMKRLDEEAGPNSLYDLENDPQEKINLINDDEYAEIVSELDEKLTTFFATYSDSQYDLWKGGTAKGILLEKYYGRDDIFKSRFPNWKEPTLIKVNHAFTDFK